MKPLTLNDIDIKIYARVEHNGVRGNAIVSGDDEYDKQVEDEIIRRLDNGDVWAWADVEVQGTYMGLVASDYLGCCSYESESDFKNDGYYQDMCNNVLEELNNRLAETIKDRQ